MKHIKLRSIPPANRRPQARVNLSSMRAAARAGMVRLGTKPPSQEPQSSYVPRVIESRANPDLYRASLHRLADQIETLITYAATPEETAFWQNELQRMTHEETNR